MRTHYLKTAGWEPDWVDAAVKITENCWAAHYKTAEGERVAAPEMSQFAYSKVCLLNERVRTILTRLSRASLARCMPASEPRSRPRFAQLKRLWKVSNILLNSAASSHSCNYPADPIINYSEDGRPLLLDPLVYWYNQRCAGNEFLGMTQMALDVLSTPGRSTYDLY
jgi:hypothetical protein